MDNKPKHPRPGFAQALSAWKTLLQQRGFLTELVWIFEENVCLEKDPARPAGFRLGYQVSLTPPPAEAQQIAYDHFAEFDAQMVWYRLGSAHGKSVCLLLCDPWFQDKGEAEGFIKRPEWLILFRPGPAEELEEITDKQRWESRVVKERPVRELDFAMTLRAVHEVLAHGRVLTAYDRYALKLLHVWRHWMGEQS